VSVRADELAGLAKRYARERPYLADGLRVADRCAEVAFNFSALASSEGFDARVVWFEDADGANDRQHAGVTTPGVYVDLTYRQFDLASAVRSCGPGLQAGLAASRGLTGERPRPAAQGRERVPDERPYRPR